MDSSPLPPQAPVQQRRKPNMAAGADSDRRNDTAASSYSSTSSLPSSSSSSSSARRGSPYLPTSRETLLLAIFPALLLFGTLFSALSPQTRAAAMTAATAASASTSTSTSGTAHYPQSPGLAPSYFARKDNVLNVFFVKRGWFWVTVTFAFFVGTHPFYSESAAAASVPLKQQQQRHAYLGRRSAAILRWGLITVWWYLVTQWCFGPALIDRSFRLTGGGCEALQALTDEAANSNNINNKDGELLGSATAHKLLGTATASACKHAGGQWRGGHDISGHVFLLVLGTTFLAQEIGWVLWRQARRRAAVVGGGWSSAGEPISSSSSISSSRSGRSTGRVVDTRLIVMIDGAVKSAEVEAGLGDLGSSAAGLIQPDTTSANAALWSLIALRAAAVVVGLCLWMLLMTAIYFHTWPEKLTGLLVALAGFYSLYVLPRWVPAVRRAVGLPGL